jgi:hypothetical protein
MGNRVAAERFEWFSVTLAVSGSFDFGTCDEAASAFAQDDGVVGEGKQILRLLRRMTRFGRRRMAKVLAVLSCGGKRRAI